MELSEPCESSNEKVRLCVCARVREGQKESDSKVLSLLQMFILYQVVKNFFFVLPFQFSFSLDEKKFLKNHMDTKKEGKRDTKK